MASEIIEPEVLPPENKVPPTSAPDPRPRWSMLIAAGLLVDLLGLCLFGPVGFIAGAMAGFWSARAMRASLPVQMLSAVACGAYVASPLPVRLPAATIAMVLIRLLLKR